MSKPLLARAFRAQPTQDLLAAAARAFERFKLFHTRAAPETNGDPIEREFRAWLSRLKGARVIELGTRRTGNDIPTVRRDWAAPDATYICTDFMPGLDVDVVADAEHLSATFEPGSIDAVIACSVFEHIRKPWLAVAEIGKVLRPGGRAFVQTHFAFPLHAYPHDYWRFSREALETLFGEDEGFVRRESFYRFPCSIISEQEPATIVERAFLNVGIMAEKG